MSKEETLRVQEVLFDTKGSFFQLCTEQTYLCINILKYIYFLEDEWAATAGFVVGGTEQQGGRSGRKEEESPGEKPPE